jgi:hypothetical protein
MPNFSWAVNLRRALLNFGFALLWGAAVTAPDDSNVKDVVTGENAFRSFAQLHKHPMGLYGTMAMFVKMEISILHKLDIAA